ncbi:hypothetical protein MtrunA17_Chr1g0175771 [Medicago truncatula]|uniref:Uncharacterized protein n=1 Tax=Medicago truncatula TaxID=3880 RepID=A0A396JM06_MEDTR|nr:hypothetical protein MtrunA17_Chr1g0175771 [Medicago truncatula]
MKQGHFNGIYQASLEYPFKVHVLKFFSKLFLNEMLINKVSKWEMIIPDRCSITIITTNDVIEHRYPHFIHPFKRTELAASRNLHRRR